MIDVTCPSDAGVATFIEWVLIVCGGSLIVTMTVGLIVIVCAMLRELFTG